MAEATFTDQLELDSLLDVVREIIATRAPDVGYLIVTVGLPREGADGIAQQAFALRSNASNLASAAHLLASALESLAVSESTPLIHSPHGVN